MERKTQVIKFINAFVKVFLVVICLMINACQSTTITEDEFDSEIWKKDKNGCLGERLKLLEDFNAVKGKMTDLSEKQIRSLLGAPDQIQLFERSQKFYIYYIETGSQCGKSGKEGRHYQIRFSSLNQVNEVSLALPVN